MREISTWLQRFFMGALIFMLLSGSMSVSAQQTRDGSLFYYYGAQKIQLKESATKLYMRVPESAAIAVKRNLQTQFGLKSTAFSATEELNFIVVDLENTGVDIKSLLVYIESELAEVEMTRPAIVAADGTDQVIDEWFYVKLNPEFDLSHLQTVLNKYNCKIDKTYPYDERIFIVKAGAVNSHDGIQMANLFYEENVFEFSEPDFRALTLLHAPPPPNDPLYNLQWSHINTGSSAQFNGTANSDMNVDEAWNITQGSATIRVAVIDDGVQRTHPDLVNNIDPMGFGLTAASSTGNPLGTANAHGTNVAGIIAAQSDNNIGVAGIAPNCKIIPVNITVNAAGNFAANTQIATAIDWAWNTGGADVLNNSWGGGTASSLIKNAIHNAVTLGRGGKGAVVLFSSGNNNSGLLSPAIFEDVIAVGAMSMCEQRKSVTSCDGEYWWGGNYGTGLDISTPGVKIASTDITGSQGYNTSTTNGDYYEIFNGTSSACPNASGVVALMLSANDTLSALRVKEILERTATKAGTYNYQQQAQQPNGSWSSELGHGMVNAFAAVQAAQNDTKYCPVAIQVVGAAQVCAGSTATLQVLNPEAGANYTWLENNNLISGANGAIYQAANSGQYSVRIASGACVDTSAQLSITVSPAAGLLQAHAGSDASLMPGGKMILGAGPVASGGTAIVEPMKIIAVDVSNSNLLRFDPQNPSVNYRIIKQNFLPNLSSSTFMNGAAATPYGLYMAVRISRYLAKVDTATGNIINIGSFGVSADFSAMTYDRTTDQIFAVSESNNLYKINRVTGQATFIAPLSNMAADFFTLAADSSGNLYAVANGLDIVVGSVLYAINKTNGVVTYIGPLGYNGSYAQDGTIDLNTNEFYVAPFASALSNNRYTSSGLWTVNKSNGSGTLIGAIAEPYNHIDAMAVPAPAYRYSWSPATGLSNANDGNPQFVATAPGKFVYTLTVTDLCGNTAIDTVVITVCPASVMPAGLPTTDITATAATLNWSGISDSAAIEYGLDGFVPGSGTVVPGIRENAYTLNGLTGSTTYNYYVRTSCLANASSWVGPFSFTTGNPVAISGIDLKGIVEKDKAVLHWRVENEHDVLHYAIERSNAGGPFVAVGQYEPKANNKMVATYDWIDSKVMSMTTLYRIGGRSFDGSIVYSNVIKLKPGEHSAQGFSVFPNPVVGTLNIRFANVVEGKYVMELFSANGSLIKTLNLYHGPDGNDHAIWLGNQLAPGLYWVKVSNAALGNTMLQKIVVE